MNYVVFDLEWNQCPYGKARENKKLPFEILEIGAVKLNPDRTIADRFHVIIRPKVYRTLHFRTRQVIHMREAELQKGTPFPEAVRAFLAWAGPDSVFCTWGESDLMELQRNLKFYQLLHLLPGPLHYYDVQRLFALSSNDGRARRSLEDAIDSLQLEKNMEFHSAMADAWYTAAVFRKMDAALIEKTNSVDAYQNPKKKTDEIHLAYPDYSLFISREFRSKEELMSDPEIRAVHCFVCGKRCRRKVQWFAASQRRSACIALCPQHGLLAGEVRIRHTEADAVFAVKTIAPATEEDERQLQERKRILREKRRKRRQQTARDGAD